MSQGPGNADGDDLIRCQLPDAVIGIGGTGKQIVYEFLRQDWILAEELEPREDDRTPSLQAFAIDTVTEEGNDETIVEAINERIEKAAETKFGLKPQAYMTELNYINPVEELTRDYKSADGLTRDDIVTGIAEDEGLNAWWLEKSEYMLNENESYDSGVNLRRALSKALYHSSNANGDPFSEIVQSANFSNVTMVIGLGGGTGSGMMIDLARRLDEAQISVDLIGVLPALDEEEGHKANAHAALSELEYLSVEENATNPFRSMTLVPFGPARDNLGNMQGFHEQLAQTIIAQRNLDGDGQLAKMSLDDHLSSHAPFTIAAPQTLRFDVGETRETRSEISDWVEQRTQTLSLETEIYDEVEAYIRTHFSEEAPAKALAEASDGGGIPGQDHFGLQSDEANELRKRLDKLLDFLGKEEMEDVGYDVAARWADTLDVIKQQTLDNMSDDDSATERDKNVVFSAASAGFGIDEDPQDKYENDEESLRFEKYVRQELKAIYRRAKLFGVASTIEDDELRTGVRRALRKDDVRVTNTDSLEQAKGDLNEDITDVEQNITCLDVFLGESDAIDIERPLPTQAEEAKARWREDVSGDVERLVQLTEHSEEIDSLIDTLSDEVENAVERMRRWSSPNEVREDPLRFNSFDRLNKLLAETGLEEIPESKVRTPIQRAAGARRKQLTYQNSSESVFDKLTGLFGSDDDGDLRGEYQTIRGHLDGWLTITPFDATFDVEYSTDWFDDRASEVGTEREEIVDDIVTSFERALERVTPSGDVVLAEAVRKEWQGTEPAFISEFPGATDATRLETALSEQGKNFSATELLDALTAPENDRTTTVDNVVHQEFSEAFLGPVRENREALEAKRSELEDRATAYERIAEIIENGERYADREKQPFPPDIRHETNYEDDYTYTDTVPVGEQKTPKGEDDIADADLWDEEADVIRTSLWEKFVANATTPPLMPLNQTRIHNQSGSYQGHRIIPVFMSRALDTRTQGNTRLFDEMEQRYRNAIRVPAGATGYQAKRLGFGSEWDVNVITFVTGVFLDNISPMTNSGSGYHAIYNQHEADLMESVRVRHTHGLDGTDRDIAPYAGEGGYVHRDELFNLTRPDDEARFAEGDEESLVEAVRDRIAAETFTSTTTLDHDSRPESGKEATSADET